MPLIMDEDQYMDDLFGDTEPVHVAPVAPLRGLSQRLDELHENGCCQKLDWSSTGCLAAVSTDGHTVNTSSFRRDETDGKWTLGPPAPLQLSHLQEESHIVHVAWSPFGNLLAVVEVAGRISIYGQTPVIGRMDVKKPGILDQGDESGSIVCCFWLPLFQQREQKVLLASGAARNGDKWTYRTRTYESGAAHHPIGGRSALMCVTKNGLIRLLYQQVDDSWSETGVDLDSIGSAKDTLTHADIAADNDGSLLMVTHDASDQLRLHRIKIQWNINPKQPQSNQLPSIEVKCVRACDHCLPQRSATNEVDELDDLMESPSTTAQLTHLKILPTLPEQAPREPSPPVILAVFSQPAVVEPSDHTSPLQTASSVICHWEVQSAKSGLNSCFDQLPSKKKASSSANGRQALYMKRGEDIPVNAVVLSVLVVHVHTLLAFCYPDGSIEFRSRSSLEPIASDYKPDKIESLAQSGFSFPRGDPALHTALSPNHCVAATMKPDGSLTLKKMDYTMGELTNTEDDNMHAIVALALQQGVGMFQNSSTDDIQSMLPLEANPRLAQELLEQGWNTTNMDLFLGGNDKNLFLFLISRPQVQRVLSVQHALGLRPNGRRNLASKLAWMLLNVRFGALVFTMSLKAAQPVDGDLALSLAGTLSWLLDFVAYLLDELFTLARDVQGHEGDLVLVEEKIKANNSPALVLLLSFPSRVMLRSLYRNIRFLFNLLKSTQQKATAAAAGNEQNAPKDANQAQQPYMPVPRTVKQLHALQRLLSIFQTSPAPFVFLESLLAEMERVASEAYTKAGTTPEVRSRLEQDLLARIGRLDAPTATSNAANARTHAGAATAPKVIPAVLGPVVQHLLGTALPRIPPDFDEMRCSYYDVRWLGLTDDRATRDYARAHTVDVLRKVVLPPRRGDAAGRAPRGGGESDGDGGRGDGGPKLRRCARCSARVEDAEYAVQNGWQPWVVHMQKSCLCGGVWVEVD